MLGNTIGDRALESTPGRRVVIMAVSSGFVTIVVIIVVSGECVTIVFVNVVIVVAVIEVLVRVITSSVLTGAATSRTSKENPLGSFSVILSFNVSITFPPVKTLSIEAGGAASESADVVVIV